MIRPRRAASLALPLLAAACTLPLDEAAHFRARKALNEKRPPR